MDGGRPEKLRPYRYVEVSPKHLTSAVEERQGKARSKETSEADREQELASNQDLWQVSIWSNSFGEKRKELADHVPS